MKLKKIFLLLILVLLFLGVSYAAEANNDTTTASDTHQVLKESSTTTDPVDNSIKQENNINKEIKKQTNENKTTKTASKNYEVTDYKTLHKALTTGTYDTVTININSDITLAGNTILNKAITLLTINGNGKTINGDDKYQFLNISSRSSINISNLKITNCHGKYGGAINNKYGPLSITNTTLNNNTAEWDGGAIYNGCILTITNTTLNNNNGNEGGAIYNSNYLIITNTTLNNNSAEWGGGAIVNRADLTITNCKITANMIGYDGGGAINNRGNLIITNTTINNNKIIWEGGGGAIYNELGILSITNSTLNNNSAGYSYGGAIFNIRSKLNITNSTFNDNIASEYGGAIFNHFNSDSTITQSTFNKNFAEYGTAIYNMANLIITESTFSQNGLKATGKAIINEGTATIENNTNSETSKYIATIYTNGTKVTITNNIFDNGPKTTIISITLNNTQFYVNDTIELTFTLKDEDNKALANEEIITTINKEKYTLTTDTEGITTLTYNPSTLGTYKITAEYLGNETNDPAFNTTSIYVKPYTWIKIGYNGYVNKGSTVTILARILYGTRVVKYVPVYVTIDNKTYNIKSDGAGYLRINYTVEDYDDHNITFKFNGDSKYRPITNSTTLKVIKPSQILMAKMTNVPYGYNVKVVGRLMQDNNPIKYVLVNVTINDKEYTLKTDGAGYFRTSYTVDNYNDQKITFKFNGNDKYLASSNTTTFKVKIPTQILMAKMTNVPYGYNIKVVGRLMQDNNPIKYVLVNVTINDKKYTLKTDGAGYFRTNYTVDNYNDQKITFKFNGNNKYWASSNSTTFKVKQPTWIKHATIGKVKQGSTIKIVGRVLYNQTSSVKYVPVKVTLNDNVYTLKTNGAGYYTLNYTATDLGTITFTTIFNGNKLYLNSTNSTNFTVVKS